MTTRSTWHIYKKVGIYWIPDGTFYRPNDFLLTHKLSTQSKTQRAKGDNIYMTPSTKYIDEVMNFVWYYDDATMKAKLEGYIENHNEIKIVDHSNNEYIGRFLTVNAGWLVGDYPDRYDIQATFEPIPLLTASSSSSSFSSSSSSSSST